MKILHIVPSYKPAYIYGGPIVSVASLCESQVLLENEVFVYTTTANGINELEVDSGLPLYVDGVLVTYFKRLSGDHTHVSPALWKQLWNTVNDFEVVHLHSWWSPLMLVATLICILKKKKPILAPRGMLGKYTFGSVHSPIKKIIHSTVGKRLLKRTILHATTQLELEECLDIIPDWPHFVLPNIVSIPEHTFRHKDSELFTISYLSRIDPKKGIELTLDALSQVSFPFTFKIAGNGEAAYIDQLKSKVEKLGLRDKIEWCGWKNGAEKFQFLANTDLFVLTSYNENFANVIIESLAVGTPVLVSHKVGLYDFVEAKEMGWVSTLSVESITAKLEAAYQQEGKRSALNTQARKIIEETFSAQHIAQQYLAAYQNYVH